MKSAIAARVGVDSSDGDGHVGQPGSVIVARRCAHPVTLTRIAGSRKVCRISFHTHVQHVTCPASNDKIGFSKTRGRGRRGALFVERAGNACSRSARWACDRSRRGANEESPGRSNGWRISVLLTKRGRRCRGGALLPNCPDWRGGPYAPDHRAQWLPAKVRATAHWLDDGTDCVRRWSSTARVQSDIVRRISFSNVPFRFCS